MLSHNLMIILVKGDKLGLNTPGQVKIFIPTLASKKVNKVSNLIIHIIYHHFFHFFLHYKEVTKIKIFGGKRSCVS